MANGMPELHSLTPLLSNLQDGGYQIALLTDGRMSGASGSIPAAIHVCPEAVNNGPIGKIMDGDMITLNAVKGTLEVAADLSSRTSMALPNMPLQRGLTNLIDNALKYGRKADVSIQASSQAVQIHIRDYGDSITPEYLGNLTRPFDRGTNAENVDGYGIGLAIASTIAAQHGGNISFENWAQGICAVLTLPR